MKWEKVFLSGQAGIKKRKEFLKYKGVFHLRNDRILKALFRESLSGEIIRKLIFVLLKTFQIFSFNNFKPFEIINNEVIIFPLLKLLKRKISKLLNFFVSSPYYFRGGIFFNILGFHLIRIFFYNIKFKIRRMMSKFKPSSLSREIEKNGIGIREDFLSQKSLNYFISTLEKIDLANDFKIRPPHKCGLIKKTIHEGGKTIKKTKHKDAVDEIFKHPDLFSTVEYLTGKKVTVSPEVSVFEWVPDREHLNKNHQFDYEDVIHADVFYPTFKAFLYLNDVTKDNGSFVYVPKSHLISFSRICFEYLLSIVYSFSIFTGQTKEDGLHQNEIPQPHKFSYEWINKKGLNITPIAGKKNTLILANTMGFHGRSNFKINSSRKLVYLNFRYLGA